jgi:hypothetical protein
MGSQHHSIMDAVLSISSRKKVNSTSRSCHCKFAVFHLTSKSNAPAVRFEKNTAICTEEFRKQIVRILILFRCLLLPTPKNVKTENNSHCTSEQTSQISSSMQQQQQHDVTYRKLFRHATATWTPRM